MKILVIGDFHYKKMMYPPTVSNLSSILEGVPDADLIIHTGDFCNDYPHSPEIFWRLKEDGRDVFGVYGNHELETEGTSMQAVTPLITTAPSKVVFGTPDGKIGDGSIGYYHFDKDGCRFIFADTNYSLTPDGEWEHNRIGSWGAPSENTKHESLGEAQLKWLENVIFDAVRSELKCIVVSHSAFNRDIQAESPDAERVRDIFRRANAERLGSVILAINGHYHTVCRKERDGVVYLNCPAAVNGCWRPTKFYPYKEAEGADPVYTFDFEDYDAEGNLLSVRKVPYSSLRMGAQSLFYKNPVYSVITVDGTAVASEVSLMEWAYGISP